MRVYYASTRERRSEYERARAQTPARRAAAAEYQRTRRARNPQASGARHAVWVAVRAGRLVPQPCHCGELRVQAHHEDHARPFDVTWLCFVHHRAVHGQVVTVSGADLDRIPHFLAVAA